MDLEIQIQCPIQKFIHPSGEVVWLKMETFWPTLKPVKGSSKVQFCVICYHKIQLYFFF